MHRTGLIASFLALAVLIWAPAIQADPMPGPDAPVQSDRDVVIGKMVDTGIQADAADRALDGLTDEEIAVLAENPEMIQHAGGQLAYLWEGAWGALWLGASLATVVVLLDESN